MIRKLKTSVLAEHKSKSTLERRYGQGNGKIEDSRVVMWKSRFYE